MSGESFSIKLRHNTKNRDQNTIGINNLLNRLEKYKGKASSFCSNKNPETIKNKGTQTLTRES